MTKRPLTFSKISIFIDAYHGQAHILGTQYRCRKIGRKGDKGHIKGMKVDRPLWYHFEEENKPPHKCHNTNEMVGWGCISYIVHICHIC